MRFITDKLALFKACWRMANGGWFCFRDVPTDLLEKAANKPVDGLSDLATQMRSLIIEELDLRKRRK